jgi:hypothetical protein
MTTIWHSGRQGQARMQPTDAELGAQIRSRLQNFTASTSTVGTARDKTAVAMVRGQYPASRDLFSDAALVAVLREVRSGTCTWCAYQVVSGEPAPTPTDGLRGLWGSMCSGCRNRRKRDRDVAEVAERELGLIAAGYGRWSRPHGGHR